MVDCFTGYSEDDLKQLMSELRTDGFEPYLTSVGGSGIGVLSPYGTYGNQPTENSSGPITPPDSSESDEAGTFLSTALRSAFENTAPVSFSSWAEQCGRWLYV